MKYRKIALIEAVQWDGHLEVFGPWMDELGSLPIVLTELPALVIKTLEGDHLCAPGDWVARGVKNELWPIKDDIFKATYEPVTVGVA